MSEKEKESINEYAVGNFATIMRMKLSKNNHKSHWSESDNECLLGRMSEEITELKEAIASGDRDRIIFEAADVANFAMMIADNAATYCQGCGAWIPDSNATMCDSCDAQCQQFYNRGKL